MSPLPRIVLAFCAIVLLVVPATATAQSSTTVVLAIPAVSGAFAGIWTALDAGYLAAENIDLQLVSVGDATRAVPTLLSREAQFAAMDGQVLLQANASGANLRAIAAVTNRFVFSIVTRPDISQPQDLSGHRLGISGFGSANETAARQMLGKWNLAAGTDVPLVPTGSMPGVLAALNAHQIDAGVVSPPTSFLAIRSGFPELVDLSRSGPEWPSVTLATTNAFIADNPQIVSGVVRAYVRGLRRFKSDQDFGEQVLRKYLELDDQAILDDTWSRFSTNFDDLPRVTDAGLQAAIESVADTGTRLEASRALYVDDTFIDALQNGLP